MLAGGLAALAGTMLLNRFERFLLTPLEIPPSGAVFRVAAGETGTGIVARLAELGYTQQGITWRLLMKMEPHVYHQGEFLLEPGMTPRNVLDRLSSSYVVRYRFTIVEGWTVREMLARLAQDDVLVATLPEDPDEAWRMVSEAFDLQHPEGWFLPETYTYVRGDSDLDLLRQAHGALQATLEEAWAARAPDLPLESPYQMLTLASIIEKETALEEERERIAGVFIRRLQKGMRLQTDPTVIYGLGQSFDGDIRRRDLRTDTPYNTYTRHGLPPTPIALPGASSLRAAGWPDAGTALYFVADGRGGHTFSDTLEEHQAAVRAYLDNGG
jgi:UPF0755 protein